MKTYPNILLHSPIDSASLAAQIERLCLLGIALLDKGMSGAALRAFGGSCRAVREFMSTELANYQLKLKLEMLSHKHWRRLVLKELGGAKALARWRAAMARCELREAALAEAPPAPAIISAWRKTPEVMAEELRLKAHARKCEKAAAAQQPNIIRDPCKMDSEGQFRLPPLPRICSPRDPEAAWTTPFDIMDYHYDASPVAKVSGFDAPILIWPHEFEAAEVWDYERWLRERSVTAWGRGQEAAQREKSAEPITSKPCHSDPLFGVPNNGRNPCLDIAPKDDAALSRESQAWVPSAPSEHGGMTSKSTRQSQSHEVAS